MDLETIINSLESILENPKVRTAGVKIPLLKGRSFNLSLQVRTQGTVDDDIAEAYLLIESEDTGLKRIPIPDIPRRVSDLRMALRTWMNRYRRAINDLDEILSTQDEKRVDRST